MTQLSASELALLKQTEHHTDLHLSIFQPTIALQCQVNDGSIARGDYQITFDNVTAGSWTNVKVGATLLVGTSAGERDIGKVRVKSITSSVITVAENSYINWQNDLFLTVQNYFDVWPIFPRIIQDPSDAEQVIFYKDYDIAYSNQNENLGAFINIGPHRAAFIEPETNTAQLYYSASGTAPLGNAISSYKWTFEGGNPATSTANTPGYVSYTGSGHYLTTFEVSGSGWVEQAYRYVSIYDRPNAGTNIPLEKWEMPSLAGSRGEGGWRATITVYESVTVHEGSVVVLFADEWYGSTKASLGGNAPNSGQIKFVGYVMDNSIRYNYKESSVTFEVGSITQVMKEMVGFAIELQSQANPTTWYQMPDVNGKKAAYHYWKWHSNIISLADVEWTDEDYLIQYYDSDRESIFDAVDNFLRTTYRGSVVSDRQGKMYLEIDSYVRADATGTYIPTFSLQKYDWMETPEVTEQRYPPLSYAEYNGIAYSGVTTGSYAPLMSEVPGTAPAYRGGLDRRPGFAVLGQTHLNQLVGNVYAHENAQFPNIDVQFKGNYSNLDIAPQEAINVNIPATDTVRGVAVNGLYMPTNLTLQFNPENKSLLTRAGLNVITSGDAGTTVVIPELIDDGGYGSRVGFNPPQITLPTIPSTASVYAALKLEKSNTNQLLPFNATTNIRLEYIEFSTELGQGTASGTFSGSIIPVIGASGTYPFNYGFVTTYPGVYRFSFSLEIINTSIVTAVTNAEIDVQLGSNSPYTGVLPDKWVIDYDPAGLLPDTVVGSTIIYLPTNGYAYLTAINYFSGGTLRAGACVASLELIAYG